MTRIFRFSRTAPALLRMNRAHLGDATPALHDRPRVTREEISALFSHELGYSKRPVARAI